MNLQPIIIAFGDGAGRVVSKNQFFQAKTVVVNHTAEYKPDLFIKTPDYRKAQTKQKISLPEALKTLLLANNHFVLVAGLGRITGSCLLQKSAVFLTENHKHFEILCSLPFGFEGKQQNRFAKIIFEKLNRIRTPQYIDYNDISTQNKTMTLHDAYSLADKQLVVLIDTACNVLACQ